MRTARPAAPLMQSSRALPPPPDSAYADDRAPPLDAAAALGTGMGTGAQPERFACVDGSILTLTYSADQSVATVQRGEDAPIELTRADGAAVPTYSSGPATFQRVGPRISWSNATGAAETRVTVQTGDTLSAIARRHYGSFDLVAAIVQANAIADSNLIFPGQVLTLPGTRSAVAASDVVSCRRAFGPARA
jgi:nucleoid-associated protein YgaU